MTKNTSIVAGILLALGATSALAEEAGDKYLSGLYPRGSSSGIDSSLSGDYTGGGYGCQLLVTEFSYAKNSLKPEWARSLPVESWAVTGAKSGNAQKELQWRCTSPGPLAQQYIGGVYGPGCPNTAWVAVLGQWGGYPNAPLAVRITGLAGGVVLARVGTPTQVYSNGGQQVTFFYNQQQDVANPFYGCP